MKLVTFKYGKNLNSRGRSSFINVDRVLFKLFIIVFVMLVFIQVALMNPYLRNILTVSNELDGEPLASEVFLYNEGKLSLGLVGQDRNNEVKVLVNGDIAAVFSYNIVDVFVKDGDVVEIDGSAVNRELEVEVLAKSDNISNSFVGNKIKVHSNIKNVGRVKVNK